jgi:2,5-diamino-6-(ribosylamino)-4(3H)-pyrimidinone 5'-phosphate reductase
VKPYVICHMMPSVDGRLRTDRWDVSETGHKEYDRVADTYKADAWICGRVTMEEFASGRWKGRGRNGRRIPHTDWIAPHERAESYAISLDPGGKLAWKSGRIEGEPLIEVLGEDVQEGYLEFLRRKGISYIFAGKKGAELNLRTVLDKLRKKFGIRRLMLEGGGETNGTFIRQGLVDELSLLIPPVADGGLGEPALFDVEGEQPKKAVAHLRLKSVRKAAAGMVWLKYAVQKNGRGRKN